MERGKDRSVIGGHEESLKKFKVERLRFKVNGLRLLNLLVTGH